MDRRCAVQGVESPPAPLQGETPERHLTVDALRASNEQLAKQLGRVHLLNRIVQSIAERQDLDSIFRVLLAQLEENLPIDFDAICALDPLSHSLNVMVVGPRSQALASALGMGENASLLIGENGLGRCLHGENVYEPDITRLSGPIVERMAQTGLRSLVAVPLGKQEKTYGVLLLARSVVDGFTTSVCEFLRQLGEHVYLAAHHAQLYEDLQGAYDDLRRSQKTLMQQERLRALGQLASGIAHDINNAMSPIALYAETLLETEANLSPRARDYLTVIRQAVDDIAITVGRLRDFYRDKEENAPLEPVDLNQLVRQVVDLTRAKWRDMPQQRSLTIAVKRELASGLPSVLGVENEIRDALTNLVFNAVDAMPKGGTLTLRTAVGGRGGLDAGAAALAENATHVTVDVADTGVGMDDETRRRCLEPFFTTKGERGTGLGLAMVYGAMQRHSGDIEIVSTPGAGTCVRLLFPLSWPLPESGAAPTLPAQAARSLHILSVDDDPVLRRSLQDVLQADGHRVTLTDGGQAGIDAFLAATTRGQPFDVVFTDLGMPSVDGCAVAQAVKAISPGTPVFLLSGWGHRLKAKGETPPHVDLVLSKPPKLRELREALITVAPKRTTPHEQS